MEPKTTSGSRDREGMDAQQAPANRSAADDRTGADRNAGIVLGAAVFAMGLVAGLYFFSASPSCRHWSQPTTARLSTRCNR
jgi:hypothetical protein